MLFDDSQVGSLGAAAQSISHVLIWMDILWVERIKRSQIR